MSDVHPGRVPPEPGDWVAFICDGRVVRSVVLYVRQHRSPSVWGLEAVTELGAVPVRDILEVRRVSL